MLKFIQEFDLMNVLCAVKGSYGYQTSIHILSYTLVNVVMNVLYVERNLHLYLTLRSILEFTLETDLTNAWYVIGSSRFLVT